MSTQLACSVQVEGEAILYVVDDEKEGRICPVEERISLVTGLEEGKNDGHSGMAPAREHT